MTKKPFVGQSTLASGLLDLIHSNVCGPLNTQARGGFSYFITFINDHSRYGYVYLMWCKSETFGKFKEFRLEVETKLVAKLNLFDQIEMCSWKNFEADTHCEELLLEESSETYGEAMSNINLRKWIKAKIEMDSMSSNNVWTLVDPPRVLNQLGINGSTNMDMKMAFLNEFVEEEIYMDQSEGFTSVGEEQKVSGSSVTFLMLYVDDILLIGNYVKMLSDTKAWLSTQFSMKMLDVYVILVGGRQRLSSRLNCLEGSYHMEALEALSLEDVVTTVGSKIEPVTYQYMTVESPISSEMVRALRACGHSD
ncbi:Retrovirus-related Pol polyprotein from transposon TNT 1-94 [Sesamum angolense]|uniref:Retrovirus-related Pol polyprotein from transposon TNT 1-94 n=1 Tax=Sesamum angolense TaxID=2727404 RepID=A0AAE1T3S5_9LAMI|nr:Retrovirus-related Pol polyprotein from transposon TNT 1-94 [Sesamum angolense]